MSNVYFTDQSYGVPDYRRAENGETVKWYFQWYNFSVEAWQLSGLACKELVIVKPESPPYRVPVSLGAWVNITVEFGKRWINDSVSDFINWVKTIRG